MLFSVPGQTIGVSVFTDYLIEALGLSRDQISLAYMLGTLASASILSFSGILLDKFGSRKFGTVVSVLLGSLLIGLSFIDSAVNWAVQTLKTVPPVVSAMVLMSAGFFLLRFLGQGSMTLVSRNLPMRWFTLRRGLVSAIVGTTVSLGFNAAPSLYDAIIRMAGWRGAWRISGLVVLIAGTLIYALIVRDNPDSLGLSQDGIDDNIKNTDGQKIDQVGNSNSTDASLPQALGTAKFWVYGLSLGLSSLYITGLTFHIVSIFGEAGIERSSAVAIFIPISILSVILNIAVSYLSDFIRLRYLLLTLLAGQIFSMTGVYLLAPGNIATVMIIIGGGLNGGTFNALTTLSWPRFFGTRHLGAISGFIMGILVAGSALGPFLLSLSLSKFGSYGVVSLGIAGVSLLLSIAAIILPERRPPAKIKNN